MQTKTREHRTKHDRIVIKHEDGRAYYLCKGCSRYIRPIELFRKPNQVLMRVR